MRLHICPQCGRLRVDGPDDGQSTIEQSIAESTCLNCEKMPENSEKFGNSPSLGFSVHTENDYQHFHLLDCDTPTEYENEFEELLAAVERGKADFESEFGQTYDELLAEIEAESAIMTNWVNPLEIGGEA